ncbi:MAG: hypothetical protein FJX70_04665 [Alphaproteobacteria bacterium]|jgi:hypothetical protein|nr:hypothetical protein [Alphaproteobacteria bacterium]
MAKQREVEKQFHGRAKNENYYDAMEKAKAADQASYGTVRPAPRDPEFRAQLDKGYNIICCGCCDPDPEHYDPDNPGNTSCCTIM